jgi:two-component system LytT family response regulator
MKIRTAIVDDEPLARTRIGSLLKADSDVDVVVECRDGGAAVEAIAEHTPDLVFLDVQMPGMDGFGVLEATPAALLPVVIFVTAYDEYAVRAFDAQALDYLLKPFKRARFLAALARAKARIAERSRGDAEREKLTALLGAVRGGQGRIVVKAPGKTLVLRSEDVEWIEASANYVQVHAGDRVHQVREKISDFQRALPKGKFIRVHRSIIVNLDAIAELQACGGGEYMIVLASGRELSLGRTYVESLRRALSA